MNMVVRNIILGNMNVSNLDEIFGSEYNEQNDRYKRVLKTFISKMKDEISSGRITAEEIDSKIEDLMKTVQNVNTFSNKYILGTNIEMDKIDSEISRLLGIQPKIDLDDVEDMFDIPEKKEISEFQLEEYRKFPELLERDVNYGVVSKDELKEIEQKLLVEDGNELGKALTKAKPGFKTQLQKEVTLGYVEPVLLSLIVSGIGLLYVAYLYLVV